MGYNPFRQHVKRRSDVVLVAAALVVVAALVAWALFG
jgi:chorismate synthase